MPWIDSNRSVALIASQAHQDALYGVHMTYSYQARVQSFYNSQMPNNKCIARCTIRLSPVLCKPMMATYAI